MNSKSFFSSHQAYTPKNFWKYWAIATSFIFTVHLLTLTIYPTIWQDEIQIIEYGRLFFEPDTDWSTNWNTLTDAPNFALFYLGPALHEIAFRLTHFSIVGPRLWSLVGALVASSSLVGWLLSRRVVPLFAGLIGIIFLLDHMFVFSYRGVRVESWVFALIFSSAWLLRSQANALQQQINIHRLLPLAFSGILTATSFYMWPSAVLLYPLIAVEFIYLVNSIQKSDYLSLSDLRRIIGCFIASFCATFILLLLPVIGNIITLIENFSQYTSNLSGKQSIADALNILPNIFLSNRSPFFPIMSLLGIYLNYRKNKILIFAFLIALGVVLASHVYVFRVIYLLPYLVVFTSLLFSSSDKPNKFWQQISIFLISLSLIWTVSLSLVLRPVLVLVGGESTNPSVLMNLATLAIGKYPHNVLIQPFEFYPAGRKLGWKMYKPFNGSTEDILKQINIRYGIFFDSSAAEKELKEAGLQPIGQLQIQTNTPNSWFKQLLRRLKIKTASYGPYYLFVNPTVASTEERK